VTNLLLVVPGLWPQTIEDLGRTQKKRLVKGLVLSKLVHCGQCLDPDWNQLLNTISGTSNAARSAAISWLGDTTEPVPNWLCRADPLHLRTAGGGLIAIPPSATELTHEDTRVLIMKLNQCLDTSEYHLVAKTPNHWYLTGNKKLDLPAVPPASDLKGQFIDYSPFRVPRFAAAQQVRTELEMCLFDLDWNRQREQSGKAPVNGIWLWGSGPGYQPAPASRRFAIYADDALITGCARAGEQSIQAVPEKLDIEMLSQDKTTTDPLVFVDTVFQDVQNTSQWQQQIKILDQDWLDPAWQALRSGQLSELTLIDPDRLLLHCDHRQSRGWRHIWRPGTLLKTTPC